MKKIILILLIIALPLALNAQEKKKKGIFKQLKDKITESFKGAPGAIDERNIDQYFSAFLQKNSSDSSIYKLVNDSSNHIVIACQLSSYDEVNKGFYLNLGNFNPPALTSSSDTYYFIFNNLSEFRFMKMLEEDIKEKFNTQVFSNDVKVDDVKKGGHNLEVWTYFSLDTSYVNAKGAKIIAGNLRKVKVTWRYEEYKKKELAVIVGADKNVPIPYYRNLHQTELYGYLNKYPYENDEDWPRVSITITHFPEIYAEALYFMTDKRSGQFSQFQRFPPIAMRAIIWENKNKKIEIPEFSYLPSDFITFGIPTADVSTWGLGFIQSISKENTGYKRTEGPIPPQNPLPQNPYEHKKYFEHMTPGIAAIADILHQIGYDWNAVGDRRIWFNINDD